MNYHSDLKKKRNIIWILLFSFFIIFIISFRIGRYPIFFRDILSLIFKKYESINPTTSINTLQTVFLNIRLPRILVSSLVGCSLAAAGASYQGIFQNPMASPDILGASAGAAFGAALSILLGLGKSGITFGAFIFSLLTVMIVWLFSKKIRGKQVIGLILSGIMISSLFSSATSFLKLIADPMEELPAITYWLMGSFAGTSNHDFKIVILPITICLTILLLLRWRINILTLGEEEARTLGINVAILRFIIISCATLITAASVAISGTIGWVGLVIPHFARKLVGNDYRFLMPGSMIFGAIFLLLVDNISRSLLPMEIPIGILTSFIGVPFFLYMLKSEGELL